MKVVSSQGKQVVRGQELGFRGGQVVSSQGKQVVRGQELRNCLLQFLASANCSIRRNSQRLGFREKHRPLATVYLPLTTSMGVK